MIEFLKILGKILIGIVLLGLIIVLFPLIFEVIGNILNRADQEVLGEYSQNNIIRKNFECGVTELYESGGIQGIICDDNLVSLHHRIDEFIDRLDMKDNNCVGAYIGDIMDTKNNKIIVKGWEIKL